MLACRRERCMQCGRPVLVPVQAYYVSVLCYGCQDYSQPQPNYPLPNRTSPYIDLAPGFPRPCPPRPPPPPASPYGKKRAVLFGISYGKRVNKIKGAVNDAHCMKYFLIDKLGFPTDSIRLLTDDPEERNPLRIPTKHNMRMAMRWLVEGCRPGDSLLFYYSGHGSREVDHDMDELDGYDEAICPVDYEHEGKIIDDEINATIVRPLPRGAKLHALVDTCFSGTVLDLPFMCRMNRKGYYGWEDHRTRRGAFKGTNGGVAVCISACDDDGSAADTSAFSGMESAGALTYNFIQAMQGEAKMTYGRLLNAMRSTIRNAKEGHFGHQAEEYGYGRMDSRLHYAHEPQLSSSHMFEIYSKPILL
ncbi:metacaspase-1-like isoform X1 [Arachis ipaensis]|uniref:metacaspase-1 n=1 Tax=Arachis hypogaea TaxID=3818 RepID=UPI0007AFAAC1|nr:metacaspase-1-like isoform X1 [Arachis ipaensis]XP_025682469.1 metacaspase-1 [Arachis hypogaea]